jgi:hypothetical protein
MADGSMMMMMMSNGHRRVHGDPRMVKSLARQQSSLSASRFSLLVSRFNFAFALQLIPTSRIDDTLYKVLRESHGKVDVSDEIRKSDLTRRSRVRFRDYCQVRCPLGTNRRHSFPICSILQSAEPSANLNTSVHLSPRPPPPNRATILQISSTREDRVLAFRLPDRKGHMEKTYVLPFLAV